MMEIGNILKRADIVAADFREVLETPLTETLSTLTRRTCLYSHVPTLRKSRPRNSISIQRKLLNCLILSPSGNLRWVI